MRRWIAIALAVFPFVAHGQVLDVKYEGTVCSIHDHLGTPVESAFGYRLGDPVKGTLRIDTALAPPDSFPTPNVSGYGGGFLARPSPDFVTGYATPRGRSGDYVEVGNDQPAIGDWYYIFDREAPYTPQDHGLALLFYRREFLSTDSLVQSFDLAPGDDVPESIGEFHSGFDKALLAVRFVL